MIEKDKDPDQSDDDQYSEFARKLAQKYDTVFDEPIPDRLVDLIQRLRELKPH